jgi:ABC-type antimicrobial peptide transport system ATPase subunit
MRGRQIATVVQDAVSALNPVLRVGRRSARRCWNMASPATGPRRGQKRMRLMAQGRDPRPSGGSTTIPTSSAGGMCQRVVIAAALSCAATGPGGRTDDRAGRDDPGPDPEASGVSCSPTSGLSILLVTHDMGVVAQTCQRVAVMYAGQIVELTTRRRCSPPRHPTRCRASRLRAASTPTRAAAGADPGRAARSGAAARRLPVPSALSAGDGDICRRARRRCCARSRRGHLSRCHHAEQVHPRPLGPGADA